MVSHKIKGIESGSIAEELELEPGDILLQINGNEIKDVFDYHYYTNDYKIVLFVQKANGEEWEVEIEKEEDEDLGIEFEQGFMDEYRSCRNKCIFCFIDQMPPGMRETLYFKDDDARLSFLQGNYITLTNLSEEDIKRIILYKLSPINVSVQTMNPELRCNMLKNRFAGDSLLKMKQLFEGGIQMNSQIVLCKGYNDGKELEYSIQELSNMIPHMKSLSVVPVGLTKYRKGLIPLEKFTKEEANDVVQTIHKWQERIQREKGTRFVFASDEWYLTAELPIPSKEYYEGYGQLENGVGMVRSFLDEVEEYLELKSGDNRNVTYSIATGILAAPIIKKIVQKIKLKYPNTNGVVYAIENNFFGKDITVAGLLTGQDIMEQLKGKDLGEFLMLPNVLLRSGEQVLLDDFTINDLENTLQISIRIVQSDGVSFIDTILNGGN